MRNDLQIPDLTFPSAVFGRFEVPWDLKVLLYKGGAGALARTVGKGIANGDFGLALSERIALVQKIHEVIHVRTRAALCGLLETLLPIGNMVSPNSATKEITIVLLLILDTRLLADGLARPLGKLA